MHMVWRPKFQPGWPPVNKLALFKAPSASYAAGISLISQLLEGIQRTTFRPASLLWRFMAARASCPVSKASTNCLEMASPNPTLSLQPPQSHPWPPDMDKGTRIRIIFKPNASYWYIYTNPSQSLTSLSISGVITAAVVKVSKAAVPG